MSRRQRRDRQRRKLLPTPDQIAQVPNGFAAVALTTTLAAQVLAPAPCERPPCANPQGGGAAVVLPSEFGIEPVPTQINVVPVVTVQAGSAGTATARWTGL
jgi:hypothetical protein